MLVNSQSMELAMCNGDNTTNKHSFSLFALAFRPLFISAAVFSVLSLSLWGISLSGWQFEPHGGVQFWHGHEMLFGFVGAVVVGFLLTAVQSWTGIRAVNGRPLAFLIILWLAGRILMMLPAVPETLIVFVDLLFFPAAAVFLFFPIFTRKQTRNYFAVIVLLLLMLCNGMSHFSVLNNDSELQRQAFYSAALLFTLMMAIIGGRVIPMFTANTTRIQAKNRNKWLDRTALGVLWSLLLLSLLAPSWQAAEIVVSLLFATAAFLLGWRCSNWRFFSTLRHPLLWSLHLGYWWIIVGLVLFSGHYAGMQISYDAALHSLTAGAMGTLILSMMSRVSLGHTGRPIVADKLITVSLVLVVIAGSFRVLGAGFFITAYSNFLLLSILFWTLAYGLFLFNYIPILIHPRKDGKEG